MTLPHVIREKKGLFSENLVPGKTVYGERLRTFNGIEYREWKPLNSKFAAALTKGIEVPLTEQSVVLYLGASTGTTASHVSDIVTKGFVIALDSAQRVVRDLYFVCKLRKNMAPVLADAALPDEYPKLPQADFLYQDIAQKDQVALFVRNAQFLKKNGHGLLMIKARSIDFTQQPEAVFAAVEQELEEHFVVLDKKTLAPYQKDHCAFLIKKQ